MIIISVADMLAAGNLRTINDCLQQDGVIAYPTDTLYGLGGNFYSLALMDRIDRLKNRRDQPYSAAVGSLAMLESLAENIAGIFYDRLSGLLPGKFTFLFTANPAIDRRLLKNSGKIGVRLPRLPGLLQLIGESKLPWVSTSANRCGQPPLNDPLHIAREFPDLDLLIDGGVLPPSLGSTMVDLTVAPPAIVRFGDDAEKFIETMKHL